ncbi:hypothetical protein PYCC9005_000692 [Savitreella phatthalungensis]
MGADKPWTAEERVKLLLAMLMSIQSVGGRTAVQSGVSWEFVAAAVGRASPSGCLQQFNKLKSALQPGLDAQSKQQSPQPSPRKRKTTNNGAGSPSNKSRRPKHSNQDDAADDSESADVEINYADSSSE